MPATTLPAQRRFGETTRRDAWWLQSLVVFLGFSAFIIYSTWAGYSNAYYEFGPYLSPMYSPLLFGPSAHSWFGGPAQPGWWPPFLHYSAAALILSLGRVRDERYHGAVTLGIAGLFLLFLVLGALRIG